MNSSEVLFLGLGFSQIGWYRSALPALQLGCDWVSARGEDPDALTIYGAISRQGIRQPDYTKYNVVVVEQVYGKAWVEKIKQLQDQGIVVLYEIDDYIHAVRHIDKHQGKKRFSLEHVRNHEICMEAANGLIVSTGWLGEKYSTYNPQYWICPNAIDITYYERFKRMPSERENFVIGWAGGTGHINIQTKAWMKSLQEIMREFPHVQFFNIGENWVKNFPKELQERCTFVPSAAVENYPGVVSNFDLSLAPAGRSDFFLAKSDLRWVESSALKIPTVYDPFVYKAAVHGRTGYSAENATEAYDAMRRAVENPLEARTIGRQAHQWVRENRSFPKACFPWQLALIESVELTPITS
jgi:hypothetical protein